MKSLSFQSSTRRNDWGTLATFTADDHAEYLKLIPQANKDAVKDYFKNKSKK